MQDRVIIVPCYNEAERLDRDAFAAFLRDADVRLVFVNDGSTDNTADVLDALVADAPMGAASALSLANNSGKAEAVRQGLQHALDAGASVVGYLDADLSTPFSELARLLERLDDDERVEVVMGARVALLGRDVRRLAYRHYLGRVFSTLASLILELNVYDTQCGAKVFRATDALRAALDTPFLSRWAFDVELLGRLMVGGPGTEPRSPAVFVEVPLNQWHDVGGSKLSTGQMTKVLGDLARIAADLRRRRSRM